MAAITICRDFGALKNKVWHRFPIYFPWSDGTRCQDLSLLAAAYCLDKLLGHNADRGDTSRCRWFPWIRTQNWERRNSGWLDFTRQSARPTLDTLFWNISFCINIQASTSSFIPVGIFPSKLSFRQVKLLAVLWALLFLCLPSENFSHCPFWIPCVCKWVFTQWPNPNSNNNTSKKSPLISYIHPLPKCK